MKAKQGRIRLTEQELHYLVEDAVRTYLINEGMDEGATGFLRGLYDRGAKQVQNAGKNLKASLNNKVGQAMDYGREKMGQAMDYGREKMGQAMDYGREKAGQIGRGIQNYKVAGQVSSINQDAQQQIKAATQALKSIKDLSEKLRGITGYGALGEKSVTAIDNCIKTLGAEAKLWNNASGGFSGQRATAVNPNTEFWQPR